VSKVESKLDSKRRSDARGDERPSHCPPSLLEHAHQQTEPRRDGEVDVSSARIKSAPPPHPRLCYHARSATRLRFHTTGQQSIHSPAYSPQAPTVPPSSCTLPERSHHDPRASLRVVNRRQSLKDVASRQTRRMSTVHEIVNDRLTVPLSQRV
jgi:hypothetical protein